MSKLWALILLSATAAFAEESSVDADYRDQSRSAVLTAGIGSGAIGDDLIGELGLQGLGLRSFSRKWLLEWDALIAARIGGLGNEHPYTLFLGLGGRGNAELGYRLRPANRWSGYFGARVAAELNAMDRPDLGSTQLATENSSDGFGGLTANGLLRIDGGISFLEATRSLRVVAFIQERLRAPGVVTPGAAFTEGGLGARVDLARNLTAWLEGTIGTTPAALNAALRIKDQTIDMKIGGEVRKWFASGLWIGLAVSYLVENNHLVYLDHRNTYDSVDPPNFAVTASVGFAYRRRP